MTRPHRNPHAVGRFQTLNGFVDYSLATLTPAAVATWLVLFRNVKTITGMSCIGQAEITRRVGVSDRAVRTALEELKLAGLVKVVLQGRLGRGASSYKVRGVNPKHSE